MECIKMLLEGSAQANQQDNVSVYRLVQCLVGDVICVGSGSDL